MKGREAGPLAGLKFAVKDLFAIEGFVTGCGNPEWLSAHSPAAQTSPIVIALLEAGADMIGKTICDELFYSFTGANAHYGTPLNSRAPGRMPGGSSSGSAAAVAAGLCDFSLGSDTGGSVRVPASFCGLYGLRPTHGRVDLSHGQAMAPSFDTAGWFAADADLFCRLGDILLDGHSAAHNIDHVLMGNFAFDHADEEVAQPLRNFIKIVELPNVTELDQWPDGLDKDGPRAIFRVIQGYETWRSYGAWVEEFDPDLGPGIRQRIDAARKITGAQYAAADAERDKLCDIFTELLPPGTVLCLPTTASLPPLLDTSEDELDQFRAKTLALVSLASLARLPQVSIPAANSGGIPVGLSFIGWAGGDEALLGLARSLSDAL
ncbi:MAG: amidase [Rhodospirillales bacterium]|nr:amidase [Rhodospirillales bacterium]